MLCADVMLGISGQAQEQERKEKQVFHGGSFSS
jgi:hypothetical protein